MGYHGLSPNFARVMNDYNPNLCNGFEQPLHVIFVLFSAIGVSLQNVTTPMSVECNNFFVC